MTELRVALIGAGYMGRLHAAKLAALAGARLAAVADPDAARAAELAKAHGAAPFADWREAIRGADAAVVAAPTASHREIAGGCLEAGLHVLVEKPLAATLGEADALAALAQAKRRVLQVGHVERHNAAFRALARTMAKPLFIDAERLAGFKARGADVDVVLDLMIHDLDLALALAGAPVAEVSASGFRVLTQDIDIATARVEFSNGCVANLAASRVSQAPVRKLRVFQPDLYCSADLQAGRLRYVKQERGELKQSEEKHEGGDALAAQAAQFVAAVREAAPVAVTGEEGREALRWALEIGRLVRDRLERFAR